jgi:hypothetical protein
LYNVGRSTPVTSSRVIFRPVADLPVLTPPAGELPITALQAEGNALFLRPLVEPVYPAVSYLERILAELELAVGPFLSSEPCTSGSAEACQSQSAAEDLTQATSGSVRCIKHGFGRVGEDSLSEQLFSRALLGPLFNVLLIFCGHRCSVMKAS